MTGEREGRARLAAEDLAERLRVRFPEATVAHGEVTVIVGPEDLEAALAFLGSRGLDFLADLTCSDWPGRTPRFWLAYELFSTTTGDRVRVKVGLSGDDPRAPSITTSFPTADFHEREVYDLFGVVFEGHPDLRRIVLPDDWEGHPLRKDHSLGGVVTQYKGATVPPPDQRGL